MSLHNWSNDHTAVLPLVYNTRQHQFGSSASFPARRALCGLFSWRGSRASCWSLLGCEGQELRSFSSRKCEAQLGPWPWFCPLFIYSLPYFLTYFSRIFVCWIKNHFIYEFVNFQGGTLTLKWTCKKPIEKPVPAALIMRTDKAVLLGLFMTFCLC